MSANADGPLLEKVPAASEALERLLRGNRDYLGARSNGADISPRRRETLSEHGQAPFAAIVTCSDSRVVPEHLFMLGLGDVFTVRVAGNVMADAVRASCVYAAEHLGVPLIMVLGHTKCGAVQATLEGGAEGSVAVLTDRIKRAVGDERDPVRASEANVRAAVAELLSDPVLSELVDKGELAVVGALYRLETGAVDLV